MSNQLGPIPVGALTAGEEALLRAWATAYAVAQVAAERERCARLCLSRSANGNYRADTREECAALILGERD